jgi:hypothetical protein
VAEFEKLFNGSPVRRTGFMGLRRNVAIAMGNSGQQSAVAPLQGWATAADEGLRKAARWALEKLKASSVSGWACCGSCCAGNFHLAAAKIRKKLTPGSGGREGNDTKPQLNDTGNVGCIQSFGALLADELYGIAFIERFVAVLLNGGKVDEDIFAARPLNEPVSFGSVEPLYYALFLHMISPCLLCGAISDLSAESRLLRGGLTRISL